MTEEQFQARWQQNREQRAAEVAGVAGKWDQADALLLLESGWTQERIAKKVKRSEAWVEKHLRFGRFLNSYSCRNSDHDASEGPIPETLTEGAFRSAWGKTLKTVDGKKQSESARFEQARKILEAEYRLSPIGFGVGREKLPNAGKLVVEACKPGEWVTREELLADLEDKGFDEERLNTALRNIHERNTYGCMLKEKRVGGKDMIQIRPLKCKPEIRSEKVIEFYEEAMPLLKQAKELTDRDINTVTMQGILHKLILIERLVKELRGELETLTK